MTKIIAEIGVNWQGDLEIAKDMILRSKRAGANFVKFQMFNAETIKGSKYEKELTSQIIDSNTLEKLVYYAGQHNISIGVSVMYPEAINIINTLSNNMESSCVDFLKIRCCDSCNSKAELTVRKAVEHSKNYKIPLLVSQEEVHYSKDTHYNLYRQCEFYYLYCIPLYPPELEDIQYDKLLDEEFSGYSNHFPDTSIATIAIALKKEWLEVHIKRPDKGIYMYDPGLQIDANVSIDFSDLETLCNINNTIKKMG